jgi:hypothetical protein
MNVPHLTPCFTLGLAFGGLTLYFIRGAVPLFFLTLPGVLAHELAHFTAAFVLRAAPKSLRLFPKREAEGIWSLGSVVCEARWWSAGIIALAPGFLVPLLAYLLFHHCAGWALWAQILAGYLTVTLLWSAFPSGQDWKIAIANPAGTLLVLTLAGVAIHSVLFHKI